MSQEQSQLSSEMENSQSANNFMKVKEVLVDIGHLNYLNLFTENELTVSKCNLLIHLLTPFIHSLPHSFTH